MKKTYLIPNIVVIELNSTCALLGGSGVKDGGTPGDEYTSTDVTYSRRRNDFGGDDY